MIHRFATQKDALLLAQLNHQLIYDEGHRKLMSVDELLHRMRGWLAGEYRAVLFEDAAEIVGYALFRESAQEIYCRQLFIVRHRRRQGLGRSAITVLRSLVWPKSKRLLVEVLAGNAPAIDFWRAIGFRDYSIALEIMPAG
jgi:GNAT superfamily N-acetyltransferase